MISSLVIGFVGSAHCAGMCGPLNLTLAGKSFWSFTSYHFGRTLSYAFVGASFGMISESLSFLDLQRIGALTGGVLLLLIYGVPAFRRRLEQFYYHSSFFKMMKGHLSGYFSGRLKWIASGMLNGLLPCGLVYLAGAGALLIGNFWLAIAYMSLFALGTLPALIIVFFTGHKLKGYVRGVARFVTPIGLLSAGVLIFRGVLVDMPEVNELVRTHLTGFITACGF
ncbi:sulfite exporter TauE/SafE family protein [Marinoscillum sp. MHG1-6]|uniref:sulfite exporter TauE/SafE family protein n=1 Tax=Marinoscillum sp. MHG1-6 TaxID=2959627 RepID=UPI0021580ABE|nr:sulfite exporter TauE/SafE family protein [Marinoscillum sp. MHG1-6]